MKKFFFIPSATACLIASSLFVVALPVFSASVSSMVNQGTVLNDQAEKVSLVNVKCTSATSEPRIIVSKVGERAWCSQAIPDLCSRDKVSAAIKVCRAGFTTQVEEYKASLATTEATSPQVNETTLNESVTEDQGATDNIALEKQRIQLEREKLEIRRQELEVNKRRLELERQSATAQ